MANIATHLRFRNRSEFVYTLNNVAFFLTISYSIQMGEITSIAIKISPNGFHRIAPQISPSKSDNTDLVDPQEGQGMVVILLNKHTPGSSPFITPRL